MKRPSVDTYISIRGLSGCRNLAGLLLVLGLLMPALGQPAPAGRQAGPSQAVAPAKVPAPTTTLPAQPPVQPRQVLAPEFPPVPENVLFRPSFVTPDLAHYAGLAFRMMAEEGGQHYLVTAHSLFGPAAELDVQMTSADIQRIIMAAVGVSCTDPRTVVLSRRYVPTPGARPADDKGAEKDVALFELPTRLGERALLPDLAMPVVGDRVWIYVKYQNKPKLGLEPAVIAWVSDKEIRYLLENQTVDLRNSTGAPVLSAEGKVMGIHISIFAAASGRRFGYACPTGAILDVANPGRAKPFSPLKTAK